LFQVSPTEIENIILQHEDVCEAAVVGINDPDGGDTIPKAFVKLRKHSSCSASDIMKFANRKLSKCC